MTEPTIRVGVDPSNPGQFFACCGLLEVADRLWHGAEGCFAEGGSEFHIRALEFGRDGASKLMEQLAACRMDNTMSTEEKDLLDFYQGGRKGKEKKPKLTQKQEADKKRLESRWREEPLVLHEPFNLHLDWWQDDRAGGSRYKTWAGQQSVFNIASAMKGSIASGPWRQLPPADWLNQPSGDDAVPFNFDSNLGGQSSSIDVGFSLDPLGMPTRVRPLIEFAAFIGLQRFRPDSDPKENRHDYCLWMSPLLPSAAALAAMGRMTVSPWPKWRFRLLYRTKYLKSFLPAVPIRGDT